jgi:hypothetical protein
VNKSQCKEEWMSRKSNSAAETAPKTEEAAEAVAVVSTLGEAATTTQRVPVVEALSSGTVKETF